MIRRQNVNICAQPPSEDLLQRHLSRYNKAKQACNDSEEPVRRISRRDSSAKVLHHPRDTTGSEGTEYDLIIHITLSAVTLPPQKLFQMVLRVT